MQELVMPREEYNPLRQLLLEPGLPAVRALAELCRTDRQPLATGKRVTAGWPRLHLFLRLPAR